MTANLQRYHLRSAGSHDAQRLAVLALQVWLHTYAWSGVSDLIASYVLSELTPAKFVGLLADTKQHVIVAEHEDHLLGFAVINSASAYIGEEAVGDTGGNTKAIELATLYVQAHFIGQGVGRELIEAAQNWAREHDDSVLWLKVNAQNHHAKAFYSRLGYIKTASVDFMLGDQAYANDVMLGCG
ncbi:GNAT family N-acetyltransferase [Undibacterium sp. RuRC25W]|uniref:GNAT family N-acetyltransferase n=1 Tax=Undibacterium sp. RuRC25W TaxID=3413047 RepID=UPI003BF3B68E